MTESLHKQACILKIEGARMPEQFSVIWHCPTCGRGDSVFFEAFDAANTYLEWMMADLNCNPCRRNRMAMG